MRSSAKTGFLGAFANALDGMRLPLDARSHRGMISSEERAALYSLTLHHFEGRGAIVDAGCFLGASTACFASALRRRAWPAAKIIHAYDLARIDGAHMARLANAAGSRDDYGHGDAFGDLIEALTSTYRDFVDLRIGDIAETLDEPGPVEILFLDACKTPRVNAAVVRAAFPRLIAGQAILIQQDYFYDRQPWLHLTMGRLNDYFSYLGAAGHSAFFRCERAVPESEAAFDAWRELPAGPSLASFDAGLPAAMEADQAYMIALARTILIREKLGERAAIAHLAGIARPERRDVTSNWTLPTKEGVAHWIRSAEFGYDR